MLSRDGEQVNESGGAENLSKGLLILNLDIVHNLVTNGPDLIVNLHQERGARTPDIEQV